MRLLLLTVLLALVRPAAAATTVVAAAGAASPIGVLSSFSDATVDSRGRVAFFAASTALFAGTPAGLRHLLAAGDRLPDGRLLTDVGPPVLVTGGCVVVRIVTAGGDGIFRRCGAATTSIVERGVAAPDGGRLVAFDPVIAAGADGQAVFTARLDDGSTGLFTVTGAGLVEIARTGRPALRGGTLSSFRPVGVSAAGHVGFRFTASNGPDGFLSWNGATLVPVAVVNDPTPAGSQFKALGQATMNAADLWAFLGELADGSGSAIFRADLAPGVARLALVVRQGDPSPIGGTYKQFPSSLAPWVNAGGAIAFRASLSGALFSSAVFVAAPNGTVTQVVAAGEPTAAGKLAQLRNPLLADDGSVLVPATRQGGTAGYYVVRAGQVSEIARLGTVTDVGDAYTFTAASVGATAEGAVLAGEREAILAAVPGGPLEAVALLGARPPLRGVYAGFDPPTAAGAGRLVFRAQVQGGRVAEGLFLARGRKVGTLVPARRRAPGGGRFIQFDSAGLDAVMLPGAAGGRVAFQARIEGRGTSTGIYLAAGGKLDLVARSGRRAPGGGRFDVFGAPVLMQDGRVGFLGLLQGGGAGTGLFVRGGAALRAVAYTGQGTATRLGGRFRAFDEPQAGAPGVIFHAVLDLPGLDGIFLTRGRQPVLLVASGDPVAGGGTLSGLARPAVAGSTVVFVAGLNGAPTAGGLFRIAAAAPGPAAALLLRGTPSPLGGTLLDLGQPAGSPAGQVAITVDLADAPAASAVLTLLP